MSHQAGAYLIQSSPQHTFEIDNPGRNEQFVPISISIYKDDPSFTLAICRVDGTTDEYQIRPSMSIMKHTENRATVTQMDRFNVVRRTIEFYYAEHLEQFREALIRCIRYTPPEPEELFEQNEEALKFEHEIMKIDVSDEVQDRLTHLLTSMDVPVPRSCSYINPKGNNIPHHVFHTSVGANSSEFIDFFDQNAMAQDKPLWRQCLDVKTMAGNKLLGDDCLDEAEYINPSKFRERRPFKRVTFANNIQEVEDDVLGAL